MKTVDIAVKLLANKIYKEFKGLERDISDNEQKKFNYGLNNFCNDLKIELEKDVKEKGESTLFCDGTCFIGPLEKAYNKASALVQVNIPTHVRIGVTDEYVCDGDIPLASKERFYVACSKDYALKEIEFYKDAEKNHSYVFNDSKEQIKDWEDFLNKFDGKDFYIREDLRESDNTEKEEIIENNDTNFDDSAE